MQISINTYRWTAFAFNGLTNRTTYKGRTLFFHQPTRSVKATAFGKGCNVPRYSTRTLEAMRFAKRCGAQVVAITDGPMSPLAEIADLSLTARTDMASFVDSLAAPLSLINALLVTLGLHRKQALSQHFKQLESIWETYEVYLEEEGHGDVRS